MFVALDGRRLSIQIEKGRSLKVLLTFLKDSVAVPDAICDYEMTDKGLRRLLDKIAPEARTYLGCGMQQEEIQALAPDTIDKVYIQVMAKRRSNYIIIINHPA